MKPNLTLFIVLWAVLLLFGALFVYSLLEYLTKPDLAYLVNDTYVLHGLEGI